MANRSKEELSSPPRSCRRVDARSSRTTTQQYDLNSVASKIAPYCGYLAPLASPWTHRLHQVARSTRNTHKTTLAFTYYRNYPSTKKKNPPKKWCNQRRNISLPSVTIANTARFACTGRTPWSHRHTTTAALMRVTLSKMGKTKTT